MLTAMSPAVSTPSTLALLIAMAGVLIAIGQMRLARSQRRIADANSQATQYSAWTDLADDWKWAILAANGPSSAIFSGLKAEDVAEYEETLKRYRDAAVRYYDSYPREDTDLGDSWDAAVSRLKDAEAALEKYRRRVDVVLGF
jgi:hypothetical protein